MLFPHCYRPSLTPIQNNWQNYGFVYFKLYVPRQQAGVHLQYKIKVRNKQCTFSKNLTWFGPLLLRLCFLFRISLCHVSLQQICPFSWVLLANSFSNGNCFQQSTLRSAHPVYELSHAQTQIFSAWRTEQSKSVRIHVRQRGGVRYLHNR
jgi:hypothetical protein